MKVENYIYTNPSDDYEITEERQNEMIRELKDQIRKGTIGHFKILAIGQNDDEYDFLYKWLDENNITIRGIDGTTSGELPNFKHTPKMGQSYLPEADLTPEQERKLFRQLAEGDSKQRKEARDKLIILNMRLAKWVANWKMINKLGIQEEDKDQMAMIGLVNAVDNFDWTRGNRFSTYACKVISRRIIREWKMQSPIKAQMLEQLEDMKMAEEEIEGQLGREAKVEEIAQIMGIAIEDVIELQKIRRIRNATSLDEMSEIPGGIENIIEHMNDGDRMQMFNEGDEFFIYDGVYFDEPYALPFSVPGGKNPQAVVSIDMLRETMEKLLDTLKAKEAEVLRMRFGMYDGNTHTLDECAAILGVHRETIRKREKDAIFKLRHPSRAKKVEGFYTEGDSLEI